MEINDIILLLGISFLIPIVWASIFLYLHNCYEDMGTTKVRKEVHTRTRFAHDISIIWFNKMGHSIKSGGNVMSCKATKKFLQARRIYIHYTNEYQLCQRLPLSK